MVAATRLEAWAARRVLGARAPVVRVGIGCARRLPEPGGRLILCGLAGGLETDLARGTIVVPDEVGWAGGPEAVAPCDAGLVAALREGARRLGLPAVGGRLLTSPRLVTGPERARWASRGFAAADMESGPLLLAGARLGVVRVILDTPARDLSPDWNQPGRAALTPGRWAELADLALAAPRLALRAASVALAALELTGAEPP